MDIIKVHQIASEIRQNISKVIIGKEDKINLILTCLLAEGHVLLEDLPGTGKTVLAKTLAKSIDTEFKRIQFTPDLLPADVTGLNIYKQKISEFDFVKGPIFANIILADEINRATPRTQSSMLEAMEERQVTTDGVTRTLTKPFFVIATQNPIETAGTYPLPEAQIDRFMMLLSLGHLSEKEELDMIDRFIGKSPLIDIIPVCTSAEIIEMSAAVEQVFLHPEIRNYLVQIIHATRNHPSIAIGVSSRGTLAFVKAARVYASIMGRTYVTPEDIKMLTIPLLSHRIILYANVSKTSRRDDIIHEILSTITVPTENWETR